MGTATSRRALPGAALAALLAVAVSGCGSSSGSTSANRSTTAAAGSASTTQGRPGSEASAGSASGPFAWLVPRAAPSGWRQATTPSGTVLHYPAGWHTVSGDAGTATAVLTDPGGHIAGYLNVTPKQGAERPSTWAAFRVHHNAEEGDRDVRSEDSAEHVRFTNGTGSCVRDRYRTISNAEYIELACLVEGTGTSAVIVAAASPSAWSQISPQLQRALAAFTT